MLRSVTTENVGPLIAKINIFVTMNIFQYLTRYNRWQSSGARHFCVSHSGEMEKNFCHYFCYSKMTTSSLTESASALIQWVVLLGVQVQHYKKEITHMCYSRWCVLSLSRLVFDTVIRVSMEANLTAIVLLRIMMNKGKCFDQTPLINISIVDSLVFIHSRSTD